MKDMKSQTGKAMYAALGAPIVVAQRLQSAGERFMETARDEFTRWADEGEKATSRVRKSSVVEELSSRLDLDEIQGRVDRLRDQLEDTLSNWRESFRPETTTTKTEAVKPAPATPAKKPAAAKKPATARKAPAKKPATARKAPAKKAAPKKAAPKKAAAKPAAKKPAATKTGARGAASSTATVSS